MPPRQPLKLNRTGSKPKPVRSKLDKELLASLANELLSGAPEIEEKPAPAPVKRSVAGFSPYPDLSMAIAMLAKRKQALASDGERSQVIARWHETLETMQKEMQKLHKLESLATKLARKS